MILAIVGALPYGLSPVLGPTIAVEHAVGRDDPTASWWDRLDGGLLVLVGQGVIRSWPKRQLQLAAADREYLEPWVERVGFWRFNLVTLVTHPDPAACGEAMLAECRAFWAGIQRCEDHGWHLDRGGCQRCEEEALGGVED